MRLPRLRLAAAGCLAAVVLLGCHGRPAARPPLVVTGPAPYSDPAAPRTGRGSLIVAVRPADAPERGLAGAAASLEGPDGRPTGIGASMGADGVARLDTVPVGAYTLRVRRIGYEAHAVPVTVREDCPQHAEVYLERAASCLFECPQVPARATLTTCAPATDRGAAADKAGGASG